jgi:hypothetical protein
MSAVAFQQVLSFPADRSARLRQRQQRGPILSWDFCLCRLSRTTRELVDALPSRARFARMRKVNAMVSALLDPMRSPVAAGVLTGKSHYLDWGVIQISLTNFLIIVGMVVLFVLALILPFPGSHEEPEHLHEEVSNVEH